MEYLQYTVITCMTWEKVLTQHNIDNMIAPLLGFADCLLCQLQFCLSFIIVGFTLGVGEVKGGEI